MSKGAGILGVVTDAVKAFYHLPLTSKRRWSAREWAQSRKGWVFLPSTEDTQPAIQGLQGVWLDCLVRWLMTSEIGSGQVWIMADELPALGLSAADRKARNARTQARTRRGDGLPECIAAPIDLWARRSHDPDELADHQSDSPL